MACGDIGFNGGFGAQCTGFVAERNIRQGRVRPKTGDRCFERHVVAECRIHREMQASGCHRHTTAGLLRGDEDVEDGGVCAISQMSKCEGQQLGIRTRGGEDDFAPLRQGEYGRDAPANGIERLADGAPRIGPGQQRERIAQAGAISGLVPALRG